MIRWIPLLAWMALAGCDTSPATPMPADSPDETVEVDPAHRRMGRMIAYWSMDDLRVRNAVTRRPAQSVSGVEPTTDRRGRRGKALAFTGTGKVVVGDILNSLQPPFTMTAWVRLDRDSIGAILNSDATPPGETSYAGFGLQVTNGQLRTHLTDGLGYGPYHRVSKEAVAPMDAGTWYHVAAVVRGDRDYTLYMNGNDVGGIYTGYGGPLAHNEWPLVIGNGLVGALDEVAIYSRALTQRVVRQLLGNVRRR
ncbi:MAG: LamG domain-containing protein [Bacteroidetes bacterium]|nr:LamG domain-containing protein [Bacteroidota bacterium]